MVLYITWQVTIVFLVVDLIQLIIQLRNIAVRSKLQSIYVSGEKDLIKHLVSMLHVAIMSL